MGQLSATYLLKLTCTSLSSKTHLSGNQLCICGSGDIRPLKLQPVTGYGDRIVAFASRKSAKKLKRIKGQQDEVILRTKSGNLDDCNGMNDEPSLRSAVNTEEFSSVNDGTVVNLVNKVNPSRSTVLQACTVTSGLIAALGLAIRQASQVASAAGLPFFDCSEVSFAFEVWHLELSAGLVMLISLSRYTLLKIWPDFAESSEAANRQILTSLEPFDYLIVAFLPGISEELLFRGGLLPLVGLNWKSALAVAALFGILHLGSGRKFSFAIWATFVGLVYGYATLVSLSLVVPMTSHALNNLVGALLWRQTSRSRSSEELLS